MPRLQGEVINTGSLLALISPDAIILRLTAEHVRLIRQTVEGILGADVQITLFSDNHDA